MDMYTWTCTRTCMYSTSRQYVQCVVLLTAGEERAAAVHLVGDEISCYCSASYHGNEEERGREGEGGRERKGERGSGRKGGGRKGEGGRGRKGEGREREEGAEKERQTIMDQHDLMFI